MNEESHHLLNLNITRTHYKEINKSDHADDGMIFIDKKDELIVELLSM